MFTRQDILKSVQNNPELKDKFRHIPDTEFIVDINDSDVMINIDNIASNLNKKYGMSFECIYDFHVECWELIRCTECGTVIFYHYDEDFEPNFACPTCTEKRTSNKYFTKKQVEQDTDLQEYIKYWENQRHLDEERYEREKKRGMKDDELWIKKIGNSSSKYHYKLTLKRNFLYNTGFRGLYLVINKLKRDDSGGHIYEKKYEIPLSFSHTYQTYIYHHLGKCHPDFRSKYFIGRPIEESWTDEQKEKYNNRRNRV